MRSGVLLGVVLVALAAATLMSPAAAAALLAVGWRVPVPRVYDRVFEIVLGLGLVLRWRALDLGGLDAIGLRHPSWARDFRRGVLIGVGGLACGLLLAWLTGGIAPALRFAPAKTVWKVLFGLVGAAVVGVGEEALFRGVLLRRFQLDLGARAGVMATTGIYAVVHVLRTRGGGDLSGWWGGVTRTLGLFAPLGEPASWPSIAGLWLLGMLLATARLRSGSLWLPIGIHAAWVAVFRVGRLFMDIRARPAWVVGPGWPPLIGGAAGLLGLAVSAWMLQRLLGRRGAKRS